jgi:hypothetical protein
MYLDLSTIYTVMEVVIFDVYVFGLWEKLGDLAIHNVPLLSLNGLHLIRGLLLLNLKFASTNSCTRSIFGMASRNAVDREIYSLSVELSAASVSIYDSHDTSMPAYLATYPVRNLGFKIPISREISICITFNGFVRWLTFDALVLNGKKIATNVFDCLATFITWVGSKTCALMNGVGYISSCTFLEEVELTNDTLVIPRFIKCWTIKVLL